MIKETTIIIPVAAFLAVLCVHVAVWRVFKPKKHITALLVTFIFVPAAISALLFAATNAFSRSDLFLMMLLYLALAGAYIQTYPAIQAWSPSLFLVYMIGKGGVSLGMEAIKQRIGVGSLINDRIDDLKNEGLINVAADSSLSLAKKGMFLSDMFILYRKILGLEEGKG